MNYKHYPSGLEEFTPRAKRCTSAEAEQKRDAIEEARHQRYDDINKEANRRKRTTDDMRGALGFHRICPRCKQSKPKLSQWVILLDGETDPKNRTRRTRGNDRHIMRQIDRGVENPTNRVKITGICRSCYYTPMNESQGNPFTRLTYHVADSTLIRASRTVSASVIAEVCGWSQSRQSRIETQRSLLTPGEAESLQHALGLETLPITSTEFRYHIDAIKLRSLRESVAISRQTLATRLGLSASRIKNLETADSTVEERIAQQIEECLTL